MTLLLASIAEFALLAPVLIEETETVSIVAPLPKSPVNLLLASNTAAALVPPVFIVAIAVPPTVAVSSFISPTNLLSLSITSFALSAPVLMSATFNPSTEPATRLPD